MEPGSRLVTMRKTMMLVALWSVNWICRVLCYFGNDCDSLGNYCYYGYYWTCWWYMKRNLCLMTIEMRTFERFVLVQPAVLQKKCELAIFPAVSSVYVVYHLGLTNYATPSVNCKERKNCQLVINSRVNVLSIDTDCK